MSGDVSPTAGEKGAKDAEATSSVLGWLVGAIVLGLCCWQLLQQEATKLEVTTLLQGLATACTGSAAAKQALPQGPPDVQRDAYVLAFFTISIFLANWGIRLLLVEPIARAILGLRRETLVKFAQSVLEAMIYGSFAAIGIAIVPSQTWSWPSENWWKGFSSGEHLIMRSDLRCYYLLYGARYIQAAATVLLEPKRKDFFEMMVHHLVTIGVVYVSYLFGWNRVGVVVMVLLDPADVPLHLAKLCRYAAERTRQSLWQFLADRLFEIFALLFFVTRLVLYAYVCWSCHFESAKYFDHTPAATVCLLLLYLLMVLQVYWFGLILKVAAKLLRGQGVEDPRSDDEDEPSSKPDKKSQ